jgi:tRNA A-37 threonylcarbamoyl transferase component Bud32
MEKEESLMIKLTPEFQNKLFSNLLKEHGRHKLSQEIGKSRSILYHYKNYRVKAIPDFVLKRAIKLSKYSKEKLKRNIVKKYFKEDQDQKVLNQGREIRNKKFQI